MQDLTEMKNNYLQAINLSNKILEADPKNQQALTIKMICLRKAAEEDPTELNTKGAHFFSHKEMKKLINCIKKQIPNEIYYNQLARIICYNAERKLPTSILDIFSHIFSVSAVHRSALMELIAGDSKHNKNELYRTKMRDFCECELKCIKDKRSSDQINLIKAITNISEQRGRFDQNTCQIIENHLFENKKDTVLDCLASLIQFSKFNVTNKTIEKMCNMITEEKCNFTIRLSAFKCIINSIINKSQKFSINIQKAFIVVIDENNVKMIELVFLCLLNCNNSDIPYQIMAYLSKINTINDQQLKNLLKIMQNYIKSNDRVPKELHDRLISEGLKNQNEIFCSTSVKLLQLSKDSGQDITNEIEEFLKIDRKLKQLNSCTKYK